MHLGFSSCVYPLDAKDFATVPDYEGPVIPACDLPADPVLLLIRKGLPDCILRGRDLINAAGAGVVDVRIVFVPTIAKWNLPVAMIRSLRDRFRFKGSGAYHIAPQAIRQMRIERAVRTLEHPQERGEANRNETMRNLERSLRENGYDDAKPITVMLCRSRGEDSLRQGHHRISACLTCGIPKMTVRFSAAAALPQAFWRFIGRVPVRFDVLKGSLESSIGDSVSRIVPLGDRPVPRKVIVVPAKGGRFVMNLVPESEGTVGIARALIVPVMVAGALALDIVVLKTACGAHSFVAWSQVFLAAASAFFVGTAFRREARGRAGYAAMTVLFVCMAVYELLRDVLDFDRHAIGIVAALVAATFALGCAAMNWRTFKTGLRRIASSGGFPALPFGFFFVWVVSKLASSRVIWSSLKLTEHDIRTVKHVIEESTELFGYAIIASWALAFYLERRAYRGRR